MVAVVGSLITSDHLDRGQLDHIDANTKSQAGLLRGYCGQKPGDTASASASALAFVVFDTQAAAEEMAESARSAIPSAPLEVIAVLAWIHR